MDERVVSITRIPWRSQHSEEWHYQRRQCLPLASWLRKTTRTEKPAVCLSLGVARMAVRRGIAAGGNQRCLRSKPVAILRYVCSFLCLVTFWPENKWASSTHGGVASVFEISCGKIDRQTWYFNLSSILLFALTFGIKSTIIITVNRRLQSWIINRIVSLHSTFIDDAVTARRHRVVVDSAAGRLVICRLSLHLATDAVPQFAALQRFVVFAEKTSNLSDNQFVEAKE